MHALPPPSRPAFPALLAVYEAARALVGYITPHFDEIQRVSVCPGGVATGYTYFLPMVRGVILGCLDRCWGCSCCPPSGAVRLGSPCRLYWS
jgi:hypothetical protein